MAGYASTGDYTCCRVVHLRRLEGREIGQAIGVADVAGIRNRNVAGGFAHTGPAAVASRARPCHGSVNRDMRIDPRCPRQGACRVQMAGVALRRVSRGCRMADDVGLDLRILRKILPGMARTAVAGDWQRSGGMQEHHRRPTTGAQVTGIALRARRRVSNRLHLRVLRNIAAAMTSRTLPVQSGVIHRHESESDIARVARIALSVGRDVPGGPALRGLIVVARRAPTYH